MVPPEGGAAVDVPVEKVATFSDIGYTPQSDAARAAEVSDAAREEYYTSPTQVAKTVVTRVASGATGGATDVLLRGLGGEDMRRELAAQKQYNPTISTVSEIAGGLAPVGIAGLAEKLGARVAGAGGGLASQVVRSGVKTAVEGGVQGLGSAVSDLALSDDPITAERIASTLGHGVLLGGVTGGALGVAGKVAERGLVRAKSALDEIAGQGLGRIGEVGGDLSKLDRKGLRAAEQDELASIESARVPQRAQLADDVKALRNEMKDRKLWLATKDADVKTIKEVREIGKTALEADKSIDRMLRNPKALAERPQRVLDGLQQQEHALERLVGQTDNLKAIFAADQSGTRAAALDYAPVALEKNRALQKRIGEVVAKPASERLTQIADAVEALSQPKPQSFGQEMLSGAVFGHVAGAFGGLPIIGPMIGAKAAKLAANLVGGKMGAAAAEAAERGSKAIGAFLNVGRKVAPAAPVLATKVLSAVRYAPPQKDEPERHTLASGYKARAAEIRSLVQPMPDGSVQMRSEARQQIADQLAPVRAVSPVLADRIETTKALGVEFLASKLPRRPDLGGIPIGPDNWQPSDMDMRTFARYVAAVEDPHGVIERLASGQITPEDAEAIRTVYPEIHADITRNILEQMSTLRQQLPYQRRLALSLFSGVAVDPSLDPRVLSSLQSAYSEEKVSDTDPGAMPKPAFGSVEKQEPTPAQQRSA